MKTRHGGIAARVGVVAHVLTGAVIAGALVACSSASVEAPPAPARRVDRLNCPPPRPVIELGSESTGVRVANELDEPLLVFVDECLGHRRLGLVRPGASRLFGLPSIVFLHEGEVVLHAFRQNPGSYHSTVRHAPGQDTVRLARAAETEVRLESIGQQLVVDETEAGSRVQLRDNQDRATLVWLCAKQGFEVTLSGLDGTKAPYDVTVVLADASRLPVEPWVERRGTVLQASTAFAPKFLSLISDAESARLEFSAKDYFTVLTFDTRALGEGLEKACGR